MAPFRDGVAVSSPLRCDGIRDDIRDVSEVLEAAVERFAEHGIGGEEFVDALCSDSQQGSPVSDRARALGVTRRTVYRRLTKDGGPPPHRVLTWGRLLRTLHTYASGGPLWRAARTHGWDSEFTVSNRLFALAGFRPAAWRRAGADWHTLVDAFAACWRAS